MDEENPPPRWASPRHRRIRQTLIDPSFTLTGKPPTALDRILAPFLSRVSAATIHKPELRPLWPLLRGFAKTLQAYPRPRNPEPPARTLVLEADVAIVGGGSTGAALAKLLEKEGMKPVVLEAWRRTGGFEALLGQGLQEPKRILYGTRPLGFYEDGFFAASRNTIYAIRAREFVLATGYRELPPLVPGNDRPGVMSVTHLLATGAWKGVRRIAVYGSSYRALATAEHLAENGVETVLIDPLGTARPEKADHLIAELRRVEGEGSLRIVTTKGVEKAGALAYAAAFSPRYELPAQAGATVGYDMERRVLKIVHDKYGHAGRVWVVGGLAGAERPEEGAVHAEALARTLTGEPTPLPRPTLRSHQVAGAPEETYVCFCEDIRVSDLLYFYDRGYRSMEKLKRVTGLGTGPCQGRICTPLAIEALLSARKGFKPGVFRTRPPVTMIPLSLLGEAP